MLDCMSNGRLIAGFARGIPREYNVYGIPMSESRELDTDFVDFPGSKPVHKAIGLCTVALLRPIRHECFHVRFRLRHADPSRLLVILLLDPIHYSSILPGKGAVVLLSIN